MNQNSNRQRVAQNNRENTAPKEPNRQRVPTKDRQNQEQRPPVQNRPAQKRQQTRQPVKQNAPKPRNPSGLSDNLKSQTPLQRQMRKKNAPSEPGTVRRTAPQQFKIRKENEKRPKQPRRKKNRSFAKRALILGIVGYLVVLPITLLIANLMLKSNVMTKTDDFRSPKA